jgi:hypothetical protein
MAIVTSVKKAFTATGQSDEIRSRGIVTYYADYTTGSGVGTCQLQVMLGGDWCPADDAITASMTTVEVAETSGYFLYRWNCSAYTSGTITCYIEGDIR